MTRSYLVTGGAGYIGSHTCLELLKAGHGVVVVDNLDNSSEESLRRVRALTGRELDVPPRRHRRRPTRCARIFAGRSFDAVVHFAGLKAVGESSRIPLRYYENNVSGTLELLKVMDEHDCRRLVFSSSATVYGDPASVPITEDFPALGHQPLRPHQAVHRGDPARPVRRRPALDMRPAALLQSHRRPRQRPARRGPARHPQQPDALRDAGGGRASCAELSVFGDDYDTPDGTGVRDYIHVVDLALGHLAALDRLDGLAGCVPINLGTGRGYSVLEMVAAAEKASGRRVPLPGRRRVGRATSPPATPTPPRAERCWAGGRPAASTRCAPTTGAGSRATRDGYPAG